MTERIDAPRKVFDALKRAQDAVERLEMEARALVMGAALALDVPEDWRWDGTGWSEPDDDPPPQSQQ